MAAAGDHPLYIDSVDECDCCEGTLSADRRIVSDFGHVRMRCKPHFCSSVCQAKFVCSLLDSPAADDTLHAQVKRVAPNAYAQYKRVQCKLTERPPGTTSKKEEPQAATPPAGPAQRIEASFLTKLQRAVSSNRYVVDHGAISEEIIRRLDYHYTLANTGGGGGIKLEDGVAEEADAVMAFALAKLDAEGYSDGVTARQALRDRFAMALQNEECSCARQRNTRRPSGGAVVRCCPKWRPEPLLALQIRRVRPDYVLCPPLCPCFPLCLLFPMSTAFIGCLAFPAGKKNFIFRALTASRPATSQSDRGKKRFHLHGGGQERSRAQVLLQSDRGRTCPSS
jgi:hypothetical protein